jgi:hypothetical protein
MRAGAWGRGGADAFCFECIRAWARLALLCPLCKQAFRFMVHDIQSETDYVRVRQGTPAAA